MSRPFGWNGGVELDERAVALRRIGGTWSRIAMMADDFRLAVAEIAPPPAPVFDPPALIVLDSLDGSNGFAMIGIDQGDRSGFSVAGAGDVNGDGFADVIIGAPYADPGGTSQAGESYVVFGRAAGFAASLDLGKLDGSNGFLLKGRGRYDNSGHSVAGAGDVNGDGFADLIIGAPRAGPAGTALVGEAYLVFGIASGFAKRFRLGGLDGINGFRLDGIENPDYAGFSVASAGDVNSDGFDDVIIGARRAAPPGGDSNGESYVVFGKAGGFAASLDLASLDGTNGFRLDGVAIGDESGCSTAGAGDVNGDGFDDLIVGARDADSGGDADSGASYVVFGQAGGFAASLDLAALDGSNGFRLDGISRTDESGFSVASAGDVNGDGFADVIIGAPGARGRSGDRDGGQSYVVFGKAGGFAASLDLAALDGSNGFRLTGIDDNDLSGWSVASAGDFNGDGFGDLLIGAWGADTDSNYGGECYVVFGKTGGFGARFNLASLNGTNGIVLSRAGFDASVGRSVSAAGDVNGDGFDDVILGAPRRPGLSPGESFVVFGFATAGIDTILGTSGHDILTGGIGQDSIIGRAGDDTLRGAEGDDTLRGGAGNDTLIGGRASDVLEGGAGTDWADYGQASLKVEVDLAAPGNNSHEAAGDTYRGVENLRGSGRKDQLLGNGRDNMIEGNAGDDFVNGRNGNDTLIGGGGVDRIRGRLGADLFLIEDNSRSADTILDFTGGEDRIALEGANVGLPPGALDPARFALGAHAGELDDRIIYDPATGALYFDANGSAFGQQELIATLHGAPALSAADFVVV